MRHKLQRGILLSLTMALFTSMLAGSSWKIETESLQPDRTQVAADEIQAMKIKYDPPITISTVWSVDPGVIFKNGETIENNVVTKWAADLFGIQVKSLWSVTNKNDAFETKIRLAVSSGLEIPDILTISDMQLAQELIDSGLFADAGALFDMYAGDTWKMAMNIDSNVWNPYIRNGKRMGIPVLDYAYNHDYLLWVRQDWLDKLNLQVPQTIDELENVMDAFKNRNPDGLKPEKVVALSTGFKNSMNTWIGDPSWIFGAYGTIPQQWNLTAEGTLEYGSINPGMKLGLMKLNEWYSKGYIPQEAALWDEKKTAEAAITGRAGIIPGPYWMSGWPLEETKRFAPGAIWKPMRIPTGPGGVAARHGTDFNNGVILINKNMKHPEAIFIYENYLYDHFANPQPGSPYDMGLFQGYDYDLDENKKPLFQNQIQGGAVNIMKYFLVRDGNRIPDAQMNALLRLADGQAAKSKLELELVNTYGPETPTAAKVLEQQKDISLKNMFVGAMTPTMKKKMDYLTKMELNYFNSIIYGIKPADAFDQFVKDWQLSGGAQITQEVNEWYRGVEGE